MSRELQASYDFTKEQIKELEHLRADLAEREAELVKLRAELAEREAENLHLRGVLVSTDEYLKFYSHPASKLVAEALSTPPSTSYLEQWEKSKYGDTVCWMWEFEYDDGAAFSTKKPTMAIRDGVDYQTLYARKD